MQMHQKYDTQIKGELFRLWYIQCIHTFTQHAQQPLLLPPSHRQNSHIAPKKAAPNSTMIGDMMAKARAIKMMSKEEPNSTP